MAILSEAELNNSTTQGLAENLTENPLAFVGRTVTVQVGSKCSHGYFVNVRVGTNTLHGIVYHPPGSANLPPWSDGNIVNPEELPDVDLGKPMIRRRGKGKAGALRDGTLGVKIPGKRGRKKKSENLRNPRPKATRTSFNFFFNERRTQLKQERPEMAEVNISKLVGDEWKKLSLEQRQPYVATALLDKQRFLQAWRIYQANIVKSEVEGVTPGTVVPPGEDNQSGLPSSGHVGADNSDMREESNVQTGLDRGGTGGTWTEGEQGGEEEEEYVGGEGGEGVGEGMEELEESED